MREAKKSSDTTSHRRFVEAMAGENLIGADTKILRASYTDFCGWQAIYARSPGGMNGDHADSILGWPGVTSTGRGTFAGVNAGPEVRAWRKRGVARHFG
jgi:hypothetical protein